MVFYKVLIFYTLIFDKKKKAVCRAVEQNLSCFNSIWMEQTQGLPFFSLRWASNLLFSHNFWDHPLCHPPLMGPANTSFFFVVGSLLLTNLELSDSSELLPRGGGWCQTIWSPYLCWPSPTTCFWAAASTARMCVWGAWANSSARWLRGTPSIPGWLEKANQRGGHTPFQNVRNVQSHHIGVR